jgi:hypothetical protein
VTDEPLTPEVIRPRRHANPHVHQVGPMKVRVEPPKQVTINVSPIKLAVGVGILAAVLVGGNFIRIVLHNDILTSLVVVAAIFFALFVWLGQQRWRAFQWQAEREERILDKSYLHTERITHITVVAAHDHEVEITRINQVAGPIAGAEAEVIRLTKTIDARIREIHALKPYEVEIARLTMIGDVAKERARLEKEYELKKDKTIAQKLEQLAQVDDFAKQAGLLIKRDNEGKPVYINGAPDFATEADRIQYEELLALARDLREQVIVGVRPVTGR